QGGRIKECRSSTSQIPTWRPLLHSFTTRKNATMAARKPVGEDCGACVCEAWSCPRASWPLNFVAQAFSGQEARGQDQASQTQAPQSSPSPQVQAGQTLFAAQCAFCHGRD